MLTKVLTKCSIFIGMLLALNMPVLAVAGDLNFKQIVFFGDSLSDNGNLYEFTHHFFPKSPPYFEGRFTNGKTWAENVAEYYQPYDVHALNYAIGGETVNFHNPTDGYLPYILSFSILNYLGEAPPQTAKDTLFIMWVGGNDYLSGALRTNTATTNVVTAIQANIESLISAGGRNFIIMNLPDLAKTPQGKNSEIEENITQLTLLHNKKLAQMVVDLQKNHSEITVHLFDMYQEFNSLQQNPDYYNQKYQTHLTNLVDPCWTGGYLMRRNAIAENADLSRDFEDHINSQPDIKNTIEPTQLANYINNSPDLMVADTLSKRVALGAKQCTNPEEYLFWDSVHPTATVHRIFSKIMIDYINKNFTHPSSS